MDRYTFRTIDSLCLPGSPHRPCEDRVDANGGHWLLLMDGASPLAPSVMEPSDAAWFVQEVDRLVQTSPPTRSEPLSAFLLDCMAAIPWPGAGDPPSAGIVLVRLAGDHLDYLLLGDCTLSIARRDGTFLSVEDPALRRLDALALTELRAQAARRGLTSRDCLPFLRDTLRRHRALRNTPEGYPILDPSGKGIPQATTGRIPAAEVESLFLCSDGFAQLRDFTGESLPALHRRAARQGLEALSRELWALQDSDPTFHRVPRFKHRDDASALLAAVTTKTKGDSPLCSF